MPKNKAFSLIEVLLVIGIAAGVFAFSAPFSLNFYRTQLLSEVQSDIVSALERARHYAMLQKNDSAYGVHIVNGSYTLFQGSDYENRVQIQDEVFPIAGAITFSSSTDIIFSKHAGLSNASGTIEINYENLSKGIQITNSGVVSKIDEVITSLITVPDPPTNVQVDTYGQSEVEVYFTVPTNNGGASITGYTITSSPAGGIDGQAGTTQTRHTVTGLTFNETYTFTVTATNAVGTSIPSNPSDPVIIYESF